MKPSSGRWDIGILYPSLSDPAFAADLAVAKAAALAAAEFMADLRLDGPGAAADAARALALLDQTLSLHSQVAAYVTLIGLTEADNAEAARLSEVCQGIADQNSASAARLSRLTAAGGRAAELARAPELEAYRFYFERQALEAAHALPEAQEDLLLRMQQTGGHALSRLRGRLEAGMAGQVTLDGRAQTLPITQIRGLAFSADAEARQAGYFAEQAAARQQADSFAACLNGIKGEALTVAGLRRFDSVLDWMLFISRMARPTLEAMHSAVAEALPDFRRFIAAKAAWLGHSGPLPYWDLSAPVGAAARRFTLAEAGAYIAGLAGAVDPRLGQFIQNAFDQNWIDSEPRALKQGGALCMPLHTKGESRVFANFDGSLPGVITLAHELGHAWHDRCVFPVPLLLRDAPTPVCETASTFHETLVFQQALEEAEGGERLFLLDALLSGAVRNIVEMYSRYTFEDRLLGLRRQGSLDAAALCGLMEGCQREAFGGSLDPRTLNPYLWLSKVHYYIPNFHYYSFPYTFGLLFSQGLYRQFARDRAGFFEKYSHMLAQTCTAGVEEAGAIMGFDLASPAFWREALDGFKEKIDLFIRLTEGGAP